MFGTKQLYVHQTFQNIKEFECKHLFGYQARISSHRREDKYRSWDLKFRPEAAKIEDSFHSMTFQKSTIFQWGISSLSVSPVLKVWFINGRLCNYFSSFPLLSCSSYDFFECSFSEMETILQWRNSQRERMRNVENRSRDFCFSDDVHIQNKNSRQLVCHKSDDLKNISRRKRPVDNLAKRLKADYNRRIIKLRN